MIIWDISHGNNDVTRSIHSQWEVFLTFCFCHKSIFVTTVFTILKFPNDIGSVADCHYNLFKIMLSNWRPFNGNVSTQSYCWEKNYHDQQFLNPFTPNLSLVILLTAWQTILIWLIQRIWYGLTCSCWYISFSSNYTKKSKNNAWINIGQLVILKCKKKQKKKQKKNMFSQWASHATLLSHLIRITYKINHWCFSSFFLTYFLIS